MLYVGLEHRFTLDMTTLVPNSQASGVEAYEDMFKEITKKLYGEEASQSLHTPMAHAALDVERSFTNLVSQFFSYVCVFLLLIFSILHTVIRAKCESTDRF